MKLKNRVLSISLVLVILCQIMSLLSPISASEEINSNIESEPQNSQSMDKIESSSAIINKCVFPIFGSKKINKCELIYNLDDSADYIYVEFSEGGYVIYEKNTLEMLEYSLKGRSPFWGENQKKYYVGPSNYFVKLSQNTFRNITTQDAITLSNRQIIELSNTVRAQIITNDVKYIISENDINNEQISEQYSPHPLSQPKQAPDYSSNDLIIPSMTSGELIANYDYFLVNPEIGDNYENQTYANGNSGTCGPIAAQLLLGYNNYYIDRRLIDNQYLNGYNDDTNTVLSPEQNPNFCSDPISLTSFTSGTRSEGNGDNSFYCKVIESIMDPEQEGSTITEVYLGIQSLLNEKISSLDYVIDYSFVPFALSSINSEPIKSEIDNGRPLIISMAKRLGGINHFVVGYGYEDYTYPDDKGTYEGYVVHMGWDGDTCVWINSSWCDGYISLKINHTHDYYKVKSITNTNRSEYKCSTCGHRTDAGIDVTSRTRYIECIGTIDKPFGYKDFYITFQSSGAKIIQTFGNQDTLMYLYDSEYNLITTDDDDGYNTNSLISAHFTANTPYILRVEFFSFNSIGDIKVGITPARGAIKAGISAITKYEDIYNIKSTAFNWGSWLDKGYTKVITFTPPSDGKYSFNIVSNYDTYLYVIDPRSNQPITSNNYNDDGGENLNPYLSIDLDDSVTYFVIYSFLNPNGINSNIDLTLEIRKISS